MVAAVNVRETATPIHSAQATLSASKGTNPMKSQVVAVVEGEVRSLRRTLQTDIGDSGHNLFYTHFSSLITVLHDSPLLLHRTLRLGLLLHSKL